MTARNSRSIVTLAQVHADILAGDAGDLKHSVQWTGQANVSVVVVVA
jgi:hypothetical protein